LISIPPAQRFRTLSVTLKVPAVVGVPLMVFVVVEKVRPAGRPETEKVVAVDEVAVNPYVNGVPTVPVATSGEVICGARHIAPASSFS
jgi:hypothetical protein